MVILAGLTPQVLNILELLYVGASRACAALYVLSLMSLDGAGATGIAPASPPSTT